MYPLKKKKVRGSLYLKMCLNAFWSFKDVINPEVYKVWGEGQLNNCVREVVVAWYMEKF